MARLFPILLLLFLPAAARAEVDPIIAQWDQHHPAANAGLASWVQSHPEVAGRMFGWNRLHPLRGQLFMHWMAQHPEQTLADFIGAHADWPIMDLLFKPNQEALGALVAWGHVHGWAVRDLAAQPRGFAWVGYHLYLSLWDAGANEPHPPDPPAQDDGQ